MTACSVRGCRRPVKARGWCNRHYLRWWKHGDPTDNLRPPRGRCSAPRCTRPHRARGLCGTHYERWRTHGHPDPDRLIRPLACNVPASMAASSPADLAPLDPQETP